MKKKLLAMSVMAAISSQANAFQFDTGEDWQIRWDNTVKANIMARMAKQDDDVITPQVARAGNSWTLADDADLSVDRSGLGLVSTRFDILSEIFIMRSVLNINDHATFAVRELNPLFVFEAIAIADFIQSQDTIGDATPLKPLDDILG